LKFTATIGRSGNNVTVKLSSMTFKATGGYGYPLTVWAAATASSSAPGYSSSLWTKIDKSTATSAVTWTRSPSAKTLTSTNNLTTTVYIHIAAHSSDAKSCYGSHKKAIASYAYNAPAANYTVTYNANGGENAPAAVTVAPGGSVIITDEKPYANLVLYYFKSNSATELDYTDTMPFTFLNWNTAADGGGTTYVAGNEISSINQNITLYAQWAPISYTIKPFNNPDGINLTFNPMGGSVSPTVRRISFHQKGYSQSYHSPTISYIPGTTYTFSPANIRLFPKYQDSVATVTADDLPPERAGSSISRPGYAFIAWYSTPTYENQFIVPKNLINNTQIYAKWKPLPIYKKDEDGWSPEDDNFVWKCVEVTEGGVTTKVWQKIAPIFKCVEEDGQKYWKLMSE
jgi:uncharacterized repeat protein (TIGR02543 family)